MKIEYYKLWSYRMATCLGNIALGRKHTTWKTSEQEKAHYDNIAKQETDLAKEDFSIVNGKVKKISYGEANHLRMKEIMDILSQYEFNNVLDVGAGKLAMGRYLTKLFPERQYWGLDISMKSLQAGQLKVPRANIIHSNAESLPFSDNTVDLVVSLHSIGYMPLIADKVIQEMCRVSKKYVILFEPSWELGNIWQKIYMHSNDHTKGIPKIVEQIEGAELVDSFLLKNSLVPFNRIACYVIRKEGKE